MKPTFTLQQNASYFIKKKVFIFIPILFFTTSSQILFAGNNKSGTYEKTNSATANKLPSQYHTPLTGTESLRTNLYLLNVSNNTTILADGVLTEYNDLYHDGVMLEDAYKFTNFTENLGMLRYGATLSVERRPIIVSADTVFFKLWKTTQRNYQLEFVATNLYQTGRLAVLQDSYLNTNTPLSLVGVTKVNFSVNSNPGSSNVNRFRIIYSSSITPTILPVAFASVMGYQANKKITIDWKVENEMNVNGYEVQKSVNGKDFKVVFVLTGKNAPGGRSDYSAVDEMPVNGNNFYRIKSMEKDGSYKLSQVVKVTIGNPGKGAITIYPNPVKDNMINLQLTNQQTGMYEIRLFNTNGNLVYTKRLPVTSGNISQTLSVNNKFNAGVYQLKIIKPDNTIEIQKIIFQQ